MQRSRCTGIAIQTEAAGLGQNAVNVLWCGHYHKTEKAAAECAQRTANWGNKNYLTKGFEPRIIFQRPGK